MPASTRSSIAEVTYNQLKKEILETKLVPGSLASEPEIARRLGVSRTPVHDALRQLESEGLVELIPRRGARILPISQEDLREIYQLMTALDPVAAGELARTQPDKDTLKPLTEATNEMDDAIKEGNLEKWATFDDRFHRELIHLSGNKRLETIANRLFDQAHRAQLATLGLRKSLDKSVKEHRGILRALAAGNKEKAIETASAHRERGSAEILNLLKMIRLPVM